jgi:hypothetical protein
MHMALRGIMKIARPRGALPLRRLLLCPRGPRPIPSGPAWRRRNFGAFVDDLAPARMSTILLHGQAHAETDFFVKQKVFAEWDLWLCLVFLPTFFP